MASSSSSPSTRGSSSGGGGVSALKARFESPSSSSPSSPSTSRDVGQAASLPSSSSTSSLRPPSSSSSSNETAQQSEELSPPETPRRASSTQQSDELSPPATPRRASATTPPPMSETPISPSQGAVSLIDPDTLIENPFGQDQQDGSATPLARPVSIMGQESITSSQSVAAVPPSPTTSSQRHFSEVSLSSPAPDLGGFASTQSKGSTMTNWVTAEEEDEVEDESSDVAKPSSLPRGEAISQSSSSTTIVPAAPSTDNAAGPSSSHNSAHLRDRMRSRLLEEGDEGGGRRQSQQGMEKLRENFEKLHQQHSRSQSTASSAAAAGTGEVRRSEEDSQQQQSVESAGDTTQQPTEAEPSDGVDWDFWGRVMGNYHEVAQNNPADLSRAIQAGIPAQLRGLCWQLLSASKDEEMELIYAFNMRQTSPHEKQIRKDLGRTFPEQDYFKDGKGVGQENLFNVVKAYSLYDEEVGYCQGMQFIVGPLLLNMPDEEAFSTLVRLMKSYGLRGHFTPNMPALQLRLFQFDRLLEDTLPLLHRHLTRHGVKTSMYASQWFMTLFSYRFPLDFVYRVLDSVFAEGIEAVFRFALALMSRNEEALIGLGFEGALAYLKGSDMWEGYRRPPGDGDSDYSSSSFDVDLFAREAYHTQLSPFTLDGYAAEFEEQVKAANAHRREVEALRLVNRNLAARVASLEEQLQQNQTEHVDLVKEAVMSKIAKEEMEMELIRYKMLYAEASLRAEEVNGGVGANGGRASSGSSSLAAPGMSPSQSTSSNAATSSATSVRSSGGAAAAAEKQESESSSGGGGANAGGSSSGGTLSSRPASSTDAWAS